MLAPIGRLHQIILDRWGRRQLAGKFAAVMLVATIFVIPAIFGGIWISSRSTFLEIEGKNIAAQTARVQNALKVFETGLGNNVGDYANWDDSYNYMNNPKKAFEDSTLNPFTFKSMGVDVITYVRFDGKVVFARAVDLTSEQILDRESSFFRDFTSTGKFFERAKSREKHQAYVRTSRGLYIISSERQNNSLGEGEAHGFVVMGNLVEPKALSDALQADVRLNLDLATPHAWKLQSGAVKATFERKSEAISSGIGLYGQDGRLLAVAEFDTPRSLILAGRGALISMALAIVGGVLVLVLCLGFGVRMIVVRRLTKLQSFVGEYRVNPDLPSAIAEGQDELAKLAKAFKNLSDELKQAEQELTQRSYLQGKADSAAGMLHNVRNALAPIRVMQEKWLAEETLPFRANLRRAADELASDTIDPARKVALEQFMISAAKQIALTSAGRLAEMEETKESINQMAAILGSYNFNTSGASFGESISLKPLLKREAATVSAREGGGFKLVLPNEMPTVQGNQVQLVQVIGNIFVNADEAMNAASVEEKIMTVELHEKGELIELRFTDNGDGIAPENIAKAFQRGYSTRHHKAGGIGLHWSANAMRAMGGSFALESEGAGKGATAVLTMRRAADALEQRQAA